MMRQPIPSINALRAFEATARHHSFVGAGEELRVTTSAIRKHVRALELKLNVKLFTRIGNRFELSPSGKTLLPDLRIAFERIESAVMRLHDDSLL
jgi:LysR family glycine cleavage system transcriptional activator